MNYFLVINLFLKCFYTGKILSVRFLLTHPVYLYAYGHMYMGQVNGRYWYWMCGLHSFCLDIWRKKRGDSSLSLGIKAFNRRGKNNESTQLHHNKQLYGSSLVKSIPFFLTSLQKNNCTVIFSGPQK